MRSCTRRVILRSVRLRAGASVPEDEAQHDRGDEAREPDRRWDADENRRAERHEPAGAGSAHPSGARRVDRGLLDEGMRRHGVLSSGEGIPVHAIRTGRFRIDPERGTISPAISGNAAIPFVLRTVARP